MNISFPNNFLTSERQTKIQNLQTVAVSDSGRKYMATNTITAETGPDKEENDRLLRKVQLAQTKAEVLGHYLGAMQTAVKESGANGFIMLRRTTHLMGTQKAFQETDQYKKKKDQDTFLLDQIEALKKRQEEMEELKKTQAESQEETDRSEEDTRQATSGDDSGKKETMQQSWNTSNVQNTDLQRKAALSYKTKDAPSRNPTMQGIFTGMI